MFQLLAPSRKGLKFLWKTVYNFEFCKITDLKQLIYSWSIQKEFFTGALRKCSKILKNSQIHIQEFLQFQKKILEIADTQNGYGAINFLWNCGIAMLSVFPNSKTFQGNKICNKAMTVPYWLNLMVPLAFRNTIRQNYYLLARRK